MSFPYIDLPAINRGSAWHRTAAACGRLEQVLHSIEAALTLTVGEIPHAALERAREGAESTLSWLRHAQREMEREMSNG